MRSPLPGSLSTALAAIAIGAAHHGVAGDQASQLTQLQQKLSPSPGDVLASLDEYDHLWVEVKHNRHGSGSCVWSECGIDDTDDAYMGDNRDGDEKWYQYRTQGFCANAAYGEWIGMVLFLTTTSFGWRWTLSTFRPCLVNLWCET